MPGGMAPHEIKAFVRKLATERDIVGIDIVEVGHTQGPLDQTASLAMEITLTALDGIVSRLKGELEEKQ